VVILCKGIIKNVHIGKNCTYDGEKKKEFGDRSLILNFAKLTDAKVIMTVISSSMR
jgi:hypothetical protein